MCNGQFLNSGDMWKFAQFLVLIQIVNYAQAQIAFTGLPCTVRNPKIVGGSEAERNEMPFMVSLMRRGGHFCGGTIIHERWILTAGHCICNGLQNFMKPTQIQGVVGVHSIRDYLNAVSDGSQGFRVDFKRIVPHPQYDCKNVQHDIALLELVQPMGFSAHIQPSCVSSGEEDRSLVPEYGTVSGWGWTQENQADGERADVLRKARVKIWNNEVCEHSYRAQGKSNSISDTQMCAGFENGQIDSCWADSGGPLMSKEHYLLGVVSTGIGCARPGLPGIYTRVSKYVKWMKNVMGNRQ
ncbi:PREDICTED: transmembrane protease serine 9 isoform X1 [Drosophila arizonae]|uniref:Transmembrane protease serine 9 isoform X1 n=1 Tax=Drosophila arizonae TaxID=7263 RepID=A0ABM1P2J8_DROAR|nr:PREDICTED: transmembrane protease serine 9 isoform X1 [Drosophila arizonae]